MMLTSFVLTPPPIHFQLNRNTNTERVNSLIVVDNENNTERVNSLIVVDNEIYQNYFQQIVASDHCISLSRRYVTTHLPGDA